MKRAIFLGILIFNLSIAAFSQNDVRPAAAWQVKNYDISASTSDRTLNAKANLTLQNSGNASGSRLTLRISSDAEILAVQLNGGAATFTKGQEPLGTNRNLQRVVVNLPNIQPGATFAVGVEYRIKVAENSGLNAISQIESQFLPLSFWYPTPNSQYAPKGSDFAPFKINISTPGTLLSSGSGSGSEFEQKLNGQPFFLAGNWDTIENKGVAVYLPKGSGESERQRGMELAALAADAYSYNAGLLGTIPATPLRLVAVRRGSGFADAGTILLDYGAFRRQKIDSQTAMTIADSVSKLWLGNAKLVRGEGFGVIREGLSRYIATSFIEKQFGSGAADAERFRQLSAYSTVSRSDAPYNLASPLDSTYFPSVTYKGAMIWRVIANQLGQTNLFNILKTFDSYSLAGVRTGLGKPFDVLDFPLSNNTDTNLLVGLPQQIGGTSKVALRNTGSITVNVNVLAISESGEKLVEQTTISPKSFSEVVFKTAKKIVRTEVDPDKMYPQTDYSDDIAPREFTESNPIVAVKRAFDKQDYSAAEENSKTILLRQPFLDEARTWLGRSQLAAGKSSEAEASFKLGMSSKLPSPLLIAWSNVGLGELSAKQGKNTEAITYFQEAIKADADYGATFAARLGLRKLNASGKIEESVVAFFKTFDKAVEGGRKADVDSLIGVGEVTRFAGGVMGGQPDKWETTVLRTDPADANHVVVETNLVVKRLGSENVESGVAVFVLSRIGTGWKLTGVEVFEVR